MAKLEIVIGARDDASSVLRNIGDVAKTTLGVFAGQVMFAGLEAGIGQIKNLFGTLQSLAGEAIDAAGEQQMLGLALESLVAKELRGTDATLSMSAALAKAAPRAEELKGWLQQLAIISPFSQDQIGASLRLSLAFGATTVEAQRLTANLVNYASATGQTGEVTQRVAMSLGQMRQQGKVTGMELRELALAGVPLKELLAKAFNTTTEEMTGMIEGGLIPAGVAIEAVNGYFEEFAGAAERGSKTLPGFITSISDIRRISLGILGDRVWQQVSPYMQDFVAVLNNPQIRASMAAIGDALGVKIRGALEWLQGVGTPIVQGLFAAFQEGGLGGLAAKLGTDLSALWAGTIWPEISTWPAKFWEWMTGAGGVLDTAAGPLEQLSRVIFEWAISPTTQAELQLTGAVITDTLWNGIGDPSTETGKSTTTRFAAALAAFVAASGAAFDSIGMNIAQGMIEGMLAKLAAKETQDAMVNAFNLMLKNVNNRINPLHIALEAMGSILGFATGGIVPGMIGGPPILAMVHPGETIIPAGQTTNYNLTVNSRATTENVANSFYMMQYLARAYQ